MRKILLLVILAALCMGSYTFIVNGISIGSFETITIKDLELKSNNLNNAMSELEEQNNTQYVAKKTALESAVKNYKVKKQQYEELVPEMQTEEPSYTAVDLYDIDFLWTIVGNYATEEGVLIKFDVTRSESNLKTPVGVISSDDYVLCDLHFKVTGEYIAITDYIYDLEDDDRLNFEISNFKLSKGGENLEAQFVVKSIPVNNKNLSVLNSTVPEEEKEETETNTDKTTSNTGIKNEVSTSNETINSSDATNTTNTTNTAGNPVVE